ncbi:ATP-grasp domain-containing protein [Sphingomonas sp. NPDC092331]|jgi:ATP-grasp domain, R2K clade family 3|uniref:ATP-grasp domain-containing protein n=1 Tax=unclassified Sphingomonas TaxID=196159 RepID=UPI0029EAD8A3|nr:ATP-grasp domain-containing protein [Pseudomonadota bacterium]
MSARYVLFCANPLDTSRVEPDFADEVGPARDCGFLALRLDHDHLDRALNVEAALRKTRFDGPGEAVYRGWMLRAEAYAALYRALELRGIRLLTSPTEYAACHHAPGSHAALAEWMPMTVWLEQADLDDRARRGALLAPFGDMPLVIKDWVKSQAGYWSEACYIPDASDEHAVERVTRRFRELQDDSLVGGIVFKAYVPLVPVGAPAQEWRSFSVRGRSVGCWPRSHAAKALGPPPPALLAGVAARTPSTFASADFGRDADGRWWLLEVGDGQVSGFPDPAAAKAIFKELSA